MSHERITYLDRMITNLRNEQAGLMDEHEELERVISQYEKEADRLEAKMNDEMMTMMEEVVAKRVDNYGGTE